MNVTKQLLKNLLNDESGQDLIEYTLLMAFIALASAAIFISAGSSNRRSNGASARVPAYRVCVSASTESRASTSRSRGCRPSATAIR